MLGEPGLDATEERYKLPDVVHQSEWESLKRGGKFILKPGSKMNKQILLLLLGAPRVGKKTLLRSVCRRLLPESVSVTK